MVTHGYPSPTGKYRKIDGGAYWSGNGWEYENTIQASKPVLVYRRTDVPSLKMDDPEKDEKLTQYDRVKQFFSQLSGRGLNAIPLRDFESRFDNDLRSVLKPILDVLAPEVTITQATSRPAQPLTGSPYQGCGRSA